MLTGCELTHPLYTQSRAIAKARMGARGDGGSMSASGARFGTGYWAAEAEEGRNRSRYTQ